jgi:oxygen-independent coproporphyrinogen-3 oxidase
MKVTLNNGGTAVNLYYIQSLCMTLWPGVRFSNKAANESLEPSIKVDITAEEGGVIRARATITDGKALVSIERSVAFDPAEARTPERAAKMAAGAALLAAGMHFTGYTPSWGILTGVRPAKVAADYLRASFSPAKTRSVLRNEYFVYPKKAALATEIAALDMKLARGFYDGFCSFYVSIPFCPSRCAYCSFVSYASGKLLSLLPSYIDALCKEIDEKLALIRSLGLRVATVYIGGGTPTVLSEEQLKRVLSHIERGLDVSLLSEYTLEAGRPDTITSEKLRIAKRMGVTRVSVNTQTINDDVLRAIGRSHTSRDFYRAYEIAVNSGIDCINTDLIAGLPGEDFISFSKSLDKVIDMHPENLTVHTFCVKKSSEFLRHGEQVYARIHKDARKSVDYSQIKTKQSGYKPYYIYKQKNTVGNYENVGFTLDGYEGFYNVFMMEEIHTIFAAGAGAVTKLVSRRGSDFGTQDVYIERIFNPKYPYEYLKEKDEASAARLRAEKNAKAEAFYARYWR